jgi:hypothetical protein
MEQQKEKDLVALVKMNISKKLKFPYNAAKKSSK